ncbi:MAG: HlyD family secretion protein [Saprospiraceae bacterium]
MPNKLENIALRSEEVQEILTAIPHWMIRWGNAFILAIIISLISISWFVKYPDVILAEALITTQESPQKEFAKVSGKIDSLLVIDQEKVAVNTPLAILENTANFKDVSLLAAKVNQIRLNKAYFYFPMDSLPILFLGEIESDFALFENSYDQYLLNKKLQPFSNELVANRNSLSELRNRLQSLENQQSLNASELALQKIDLQRSKALFEEGLIAAQDYETKQMAMLQAERGFKNGSISISQAKEAIDNAKLTTQNISINRTKEEKNLLRNVIQSFVKLKKAIKDWELKYILKSTIAGKVAFLDYWTKNQTVTAGDLIFTIIPTQHQGYLARLKTPALNSGKMKLGQIVNLKLENYPETEFGTLKGNISKISLVTDVEGRYSVEVTLPEKLITSYQKELVFRQEMQGQGEIITEDLRLIERFFYQLKEAFKP